MFKAYVPKITLPSGESDIRKGDGIGMIINGRVMLVDAFQGDEATNGLISWLKSNGVTQIDLAVCTHAHGDHWGGFKPIVNAGIPIKEFRCYHIASIRGGNDASREDSDNLLALIRWLQARGTRVLFVDHGSVLSFEDTTWKIYRKQPARVASDDPNAWEYVNNGSLVLYSPELGLVLGGDGPGDLETALDYFGAVVSGYDISHHGNKCPQHDAAALKRHGCVVAWESCVERKGPGTTEWTEFGARRVVQQKIPVWMQDAQIYIHAENGLISFRRGNKTISKKVPYQGKGGKTVGRWVNDKGWKYQNADGSWAHGWAQLSWSKGKDWFYFDGNGYCVYGWHFLKWSKGSNWFYFDPKSAAMRTGWVYDNGSWYYLDPETGAMRTGWVTYKGKKCYLEPLSDKTHVQGVCYVNRIAVIGGKTYRFDNDGYAAEEKGGGASINRSKKIIDISEFQGDVDWAKASSEVGAVYIRCGLRGSLKETAPADYKKIRFDKKWARNLAEVQKYGIPFAPYYFPTAVTDAEALEGAKWFYERVKDLNLAFPPALDSENVWGKNKEAGRANGLSKAERTRLLKIVTDYFNASGMNIGIYASASWLNSKIDMSAFPQCVRDCTWVADSTGAVDYKGYYWLHQYGKGACAGFSDDIDLNRITGTIPPARINAAPAVQKTESPIDVAISIAESYLGYHEGANNKTVFGDTMHSIQPRNMDSCAPWCDAFVDFVLLKTCEHFGYGETTARKVLCGDFDDYTYNSVALYKKAGRWSQTPHRGDQIFFGGSGHTGIVTSVNGGTVHTIEGNKGDEVRRGSYSVNSPSIIGYGRPRYELITGQMTAEDMPLIKRGSKCEAVKKLQQILNAKGYKLSVDGDFGPATEAAVKAYQKANHLEVDGEVGPMTWAALIEGSK